jgi:hypothetical protein
MKNKKGIFYKKSRAKIIDLTTTENAFEPTVTGGIFRRKHGQLRIRYRNSKGQLSKPNKRSKIRYELYDTKNQKIIYKSEYKKHKRLPTNKQIITIAQRYFNKGSGSAFKTMNLKLGKDEMTIDIEFETP